MINLKATDLNLFVVFDAIYKEMSLTKAAEALNLTQPAVSHSLARLRDLFDDPLFIRQGNQMVPSPLAKLQREKIRSALSQFAQVLERVDVFEPDKSNRVFNLAMRDVLEATFLPPLSQSIKRQAPAIAIQSARVSRRELSKQLAQGKIDLFFDVSLPTDPEILQHQLLSDELVVMCRKRHSCLKRRWGIQNYLANQHASVSSRASGPSVEDIELSKHQFRREIQLRCQHYFAASRVVAMSDLLLTLPKTYGEILAKHNPVELLPFPIKISAIEIFMYWHQQFDDDLGHQWLRTQAIGSLELFSSEKEHH